MDIKHVAHLLSVYKKAWERQDPELITSIFSPKARYFERAFQKPFSGREEIRRYWVENVLKRQKNIKFHVEHIHLAGNTAFVEWNARFYSKPHRYMVKMRAIMVLSFDRSGRISTLKEYWSSVHLRNGKIIEK